MNEKTRKRHEARAKIAKAMAHPSRLLMLDLLQVQEMCVSDLTEKVGADQSTVSKYLAVLKDDWLIDVRKEDALSYGLSSGAAFATVVGVLIEVPLMLMLVKFCLRTQNWFPQVTHSESAATTQ